MKCALLVVVALILQDAGPYHGQTVESPPSRAERVRAYELDPSLPDVPIGEWMRSLVQTTSEVIWTPTDCPATHEDVETAGTTPAVCVRAIVSRLTGPDLDTLGHVPLREPVVSISIRLGTGHPYKGAWQLEPPRVEDAFIERELDSVSVPRLRDLARLLRLTPRQWPKSELSVASKDIRCDKTQPAPGDHVRCQATIRNRGPVAALARVSVSIATSGNDVGLGKGLPRQAIPANGQIVVSWDWDWPAGRAWWVIVFVELHTPGGYGGYRIAMTERNVEDNRAEVSVPPRR
jgi:hypothetical protein